MDLNKVNRKTRRVLATIGVAVMVTAAAAVGLAYQYTLWDECLSKNSFLFCLHVLDK